MRRGECMGREGGRKGGREGGDERERKEDEGTAVAICTRLP